MKVYVVLEAWPYDGAEVSAVFLHKETADAYAEGKQTAAGGPNGPGPYYYVSEHEVKE
jgi:hypothetical protein